MQGEVKCEGKVSVGALPWEVSERLAQFAGNWLVYAPEENAIIVRHVPPVICPPTTALACELITMLDSIPAEYREAMPGGALCINEQGGPVMRLAVQDGEVRIQWPRQNQ
jgi:hypothetical protein